MSSMASERVNILPPEPSIWMCSSACKKASVILYERNMLSLYAYHTKYLIMKQIQLLKSEYQCEKGKYSHILYDLNHVVLVGSSVERVPRMEQVIEIVHLLLTELSKRYH